MGYSECDKRVLPLVLLIIILASAVLALLLRRRSERIRSIPTAMIAVFLLFIEVIKQRYNFVNGSFDLFQLPLHYCSLFFIVIPLAELFGKKMSRIFRPIAACMAFMVSVAMYVYPNGILGKSTEIFGEDFYHTHSLTFHVLIVTYFVLVVALRLCQPRVRDTVHVGVIGAAYTAVALPLAYMLETNYCNFLESVIPIFDEFRLAYGQTAYTVAVIFFITVGAMLVGLIYVGLYTAIRKLLRLCFCSPKRKNTQADKPETEL